MTINIIINRLLIHKINHNYNQVQILYKITILKNN